ncbi:hypothetical protein ACWD6I_27300 [Streptomyces sp. NPDC002454]
MHDRLPVRPVRTDELRPGHARQFPRSPSRALGTSHERPDRATARSGRGEGFAAGIPQLLSSSADAAVTRPTSPTIPVPLRRAALGLLSSPRT